MRERMRMNHAQPQSHDPAKKAVPPLDGAVRPVALATPAASTTHPAVVQRTLKTQK